jgi:predicted nucleic acid-binding protein
MSPFPQRIAVTDACIFIDLIELSLITPFFQLGDTQLKLEIHTTLEVLDELYPEQQEILKAYEAVSKLRVHTISTEDLENISSMTFSKALSQQDRSVIYMASQLNAMVLSSDKPVRKFAQKNAIEVHGMFWILDQLVEQDMLTGHEASNKLHQLMRSNLIYQNNVKLWKEANKRIISWEKGSG